ncbi:hypothetical protein PIB30_045735 [Stylosanthes scabra]|uniref:Uncharacterized protein n=1 Tax=Stylosanthes scabra TaxID=79078 RepID=A0ABU6ZF13_9FABA|nr:hypothetical protein [Stylosanthes scabra]
MRTFRVLKQLGMLARMQEGSPRKMIRSGAAWRSNTSYLVHRGPILRIEKCLGKAKESNGSNGFMKRSRKREKVACKVASRLHEQLLMLRTQLSYQAKVAHATLNIAHATSADSKVAYATFYVGHASCSPKTPKLKARIGILSLGA